MESDESDGSFPPWVSLEYSQMLLLASPSPVIFSSLSPASVSSLGSLLEKRGARPGSYRAETKSVKVLMELEGVPLERVCLLDPRAEKEISPGDREEFDWFLRV
jgi:ribosome biogenesis SPOUT family RNA methylase Rps3